MIEEQAAVVKQVFEWVGCDRLSIGEVSRRLKEKGIRTATGKTWWDRATVWGMLKNMAYMGSAAFGKTRTGERRKRPMPQRGHSKTPRRTGSTYDTSKEDWLLIPVPAIVDEALFETVQEQLDANRQPVTADPFEHLLHHSRLLFDHFVRGRAVALLLRDVTIAIRSIAEHIHAATLSRVTFASPRPFQNLRAFVLGEHALHLEQQVFEWVGCDRLSIGIELFMHRFEKRFIDDRRYGNQQPVFP